MVVGQKYLKLCHIFPRSIEVSAVTDGAQQILRTFVEIAYWTNTAGIQLRIKSQQVGQIDKGNMDDSWIHLNVV